MEQSKRREDRIEQIHVEDQAENGIYDFSVGGLALAMDGHHTENAAVVLKISVGDMKISVKAKVAHSTVFGNRYRVGFQYMEMTEDAKEMLREMVNRYSRGVPVKVEEVRR